MTTHRNLLACTAAALALAAGGTAFAQSKTLYVGMNGGNYERTFTQAVFPDFEKANDVKVVVVPGTSSDILAKAKANKASKDKDADKAPALFSTVLLKDLAKSEDLRFILQTA